MKRRRCRHEAKRTLTSPWAEDSLHAPQVRFISKTKKPTTRVGFRFGGATRNRTGDKGFADLCLTAWLWRHMYFQDMLPSRDLWKFSKIFGNEMRIRTSSIRTRILMWSGLRGSNPPPRPWQGRALPNELNPRFEVTECLSDPFNGASGRNRTNDTGIFSPLLYQLSYRGKQSWLLTRPDVHDSLPIHPVYAY